MCSAWWLVDAPCRLGDVYGWDALSLLMDAGWALTVIRILLAVFFVMVLITALLACVHVAIDMGGELTRGSSSDTADSGETTCDGEEDTTEIKRCLDVNQS